METGICKLQPAASVDITLPSMKFLLPNRCLNHLRSKQFNQTLPIFCVSKKMLTKECNMARQEKENSKANGSAMENCGFLRCTTYEFSPVRFLKNLGLKVANGLMRIFRPSPPKVSSSSSSRRSKPFVTPAVDSHRNAAIEDCIQFINSSASLPRSNSASATFH